MIIIILCLVYSMSSLFMKGYNIPRIRETVHYRLYYYPETVSRESFSGYCPKYIPGHRKGPFQTGFLEKVSRDSIPEKSKSLVWTR